MILNIHALNIGPIEGILFFEEQFLRLHTDHGPFSITVTAAPVFCFLWQFLELPAEGERKIQVP
jgi:hypothetical protein